jgi:hypothetical protein
MSVSVPLRLSMCSRSALLSWCRAAMTVAAASSLLRSPAHSAVLAFSLFLSWLVRCGSEPRSGCYGRARRRGCPIRQQRRPPGEYPVGDEQRHPHHRQPMRLALSRIRVSVSRLLSRGAGKVISPPCNSNLCAHVRLRTAITAGQDHRPRTRVFEGTSPGAPLRAEREAHHAENIRSEADLSLLQLVV